MENRGRGGVGELHKDKAELMVGSAWAEEGYSGEFTAVSSSPVFAWRWRCSGVLRKGKGEEARVIECRHSPDADARKRR